MAYDQLPSKEALERAVAGLQSRNITVHRVKDRAAALDMLRTLLPEGAEIMTGSSTTLDQIGFVDQLKSGRHPWKSFKDRIFAEKDPAKQAALRRQSVLSEHFIGSVHAITEDGVAVIASYSGSQIPAYAFCGQHVIWVAGAQKIVPTLEDGLRRVRDYCLPLEDRRMKSTGAPGSGIGMMLIFERLTLPFRKIDLVLVDEILGF